MIIFITIAHSYLSDSTTVSGSMVDGYQGDNLALNLKIIFLNFYFNLIVRKIKISKPIFHFCINKCFSLLLLHFEMSKN